MQEINNNTSIVNYGAFESIGATFSWELCFLNGSIRKGYSKPAGQAEPFPNDKFGLLKSCISRIWVKNGYNSKLQYMGVYRQRSDDRKKDIPLFALLPNEFRLSQEMKAKPDQDTAELRAFLKSLYASTQEMYHISDANDPFQLGIASSKQAPIQRAVVKTKNFDELYKEAKTIIFRTWKQFDQHIDSLPKFLTQGERNAIMTAIYGNTANEKWQK
jgi:hypothetical protein